LNIVSLVPQIHFHAPYVLLALSGRADRGEDRHLVIATPKLSPKKEPLAKKIGDLLRTSGPAYLAAMAAARARQGALGFIERLLRRPIQSREHLSVGDACRRVGAEVIEVRTLRDPGLRERIAAFEPDLLCAVFFNQIVPAALREIPALGSLNVHPSRLPDYRGVSPCFWVLARGEARTGITIHRMTDVLDRGAILARDTVEILRRDTVHSLYRRCARRGGELLAGLLDEPWRLSAPAGEPSEEGSYFSTITAAAVREFRSRGKKFF
jgi:hypothetical protein